VEGGPDAGVAVGFVVDAEGYVFHGFGGGDCADSRSHSFSVRWGRVIMCKGRERKDRD
jgi:hypothetical protein